MRYIENPLEDPTRKIIYELIIAEPGINQQKIASAVRHTTSSTVKYNRSSIGHHLQVLEDFGLITPKLCGWKHYFANGGLVDRRHKAIIIALRAERALEIVKALAKHGPSSSRVISQAIGVLPDKIAFRLEQLVKQGVIQRREDPDDDRRYRYFLTDQGLVQLIIERYFDARQT